MVSKWNWVRAPIETRFFSFLVTDGGSFWSMVIATNVTKQERLVAN